MSIGGMNAIVNEIKLRDYDLEQLNNFCVERQIEVWTKLRTHEGDDDSANPLRYRGRGTV